MGAHARQLSRLRLKSFRILKPEINSEVSHSWQYGTVLQANFQPLALVTYARYDPAVKNKHSLEWPTSLLISGLTMHKLLRRKRESCRACTPVEPWLFRYTTKIRTRRVHPLPFGSRTTRRPAGAAGGPEARIGAGATIR